MPTISITHRLLAITIAAAVVAAACAGGSDSTADTVVISTPADVAVPTTTTQPPLTTTTSSPTTTTRPATTTTTASTTTTTAAPTTTTEPPPTTAVVNGVPIWEQYELKPALVGVAALTGLPADEATTSRPIIAAKIDNFSRARPQWGLDRADAVIEENVEGVTRFVALFHTDLPPELGPVRSARTGDLDLFASLNRPVLVWSGGNQGVTNWVESAADSGILTNFTAQRNPCYRRNSSRSAPHNLVLDPECASNTALEFDRPAGPANPMWEIVDDWTPDPEMDTSPDTSFDVEMDGVDVTWTWDPSSGTYLRSQNGQAHVAMSGARIAVNTVVELFSFHARSPVDGRSPNPITVGGTRAVVHRDGTRIEGIWHRPNAYADFVFLDESSGVHIPLDAGKTFIQLVRDR